MLAEFLVNRAAIWRASNSNRNYAKIMIQTSDLQHWITDYLGRQSALLASLPVAEIAKVAERVRKAGLDDKNIFIIGNGGSAASASHFATDLGKGASDRSPARLRVMSLTDNVPWLTALGNDYSYAEVFVRQLMNFARPKDVLIAVSVSGNSPNLIEAVQWANQEGLETVALVGAKRGRLAELAQQTIVVEDGHYGRVEDLHMTILHLLCYAIMEEAPPPR
jgi:D-sedoheptulose 7-phosphate isomerase